MSTTRASIKTYRATAGSLVSAMATAWHRDRDDQFPDGRRLGTEWLGQG